MGNCCFCIRQRMPNSINVTLLIHKMASDGYIRIDPVKIFPSDTGVFLAGVEKCIIKKHVQLVTGLWVFSDTGSIRQTRRRCFASGARYVIAVLSTSSLPFDYVFVLEHVCGVKAKDGLGRAPRALWPLVVATCLSSCTANTSSRSSGTTGCPRPTVVSVSLQRRLCSSEISVSSIAVP